jgi:hypothetical protein
MSTLSDLRPGDIGFALHVRPKSADLLILAGQMALGEPGYPHHVFVVTQGGSSPKAVEAMPNGAREVDIDGRWGADYVYLRPAYQSADPTFEVDMPGHPYAIGQSELVAQCAREYIGVPYSFADYVAIAGVHFGIKNGLVRRYVKASGHQICSQLADQALCDAGFHVYDDGRLPGDVTPSDLFRTLKAMPGTIELAA